MDFFETIERDNEVALLGFYMPFFAEEQDASQFLELIYSYDWNDRIPRQMVNQVYRFVTLASRIEQIWPARDGLRIIFIKTCLEALCYLSKEKKDLFYNSFSACFSDEGKQIILSRFRLTSYTELINGTPYVSYYSLTISDILEIIRLVRNKVVHDGDYWGLQLFAYGRDAEVKWCTGITTDERFLANRTIPKVKHNTKYSFETSLTFEVFRFYFTEACINYVKSYVSKLPTGDCAVNNRSL